MTSIRNRLFWCTPLLLVGCGKVDSKYRIYNETTYWPAIMTVAALFSLIFTITYVARTFKNPGITKLDFFILAIWMIVPPVWFWIEFFYIYRPFGNLAEEGFEHFKYGQDLTKAFWAGGVALMVAYVSYKKKK